MRPELTGGVGHLTVQLAKLLGAYVIGTVRGAKHWRSDLAPGVRALPRQ
ncbi:hypothetical protein [Nonomuraea sp. NPDC048916]